MAYLLFLALSILSHATTPVCCVIREGFNLVKQEFSCKGDPEACCRQASRGLFQGMRQLIETHDGKCRNVDLHIYDSDVEVCYRRTFFGQSTPVLGLGSDLASGALNINHAWIRTPRNEAGMGLRKGSVAMTEWSDHSGQGSLEGSACFPVATCHTACVEEATQLGKATGLYSALNTCHEVVVAALTRCGCLNTCIHAGWGGVCRAWVFPPLGHGLTRK